MNFNFSYSTYDTYCKSPLWFYFMKIAKAEETDTGMQVYGDAGNVVHNAIEDYIKTRKDTFDFHWDSYDIDNQTGFRNCKLSKEKYRQMYETGKNICKYIITYYGRNSIRPELEIYKKFEGFPLKIRAFIDLYVETIDGDIIIYDWKTNSTCRYNDHLKQRLLYSWLVLQVTGKIPLCKWIYLKDDKVIEDRFSIEQLQEFFTNKMQRFAREIQKKGTDINNYEGGEWTNPFNKYYTLCSQEMQRRAEKKEIPINLAIKGHYVFIEGDVDSTLEAGIDEATKFDLPDKYFMQKAVKEKARGKVNVEDVGTIHLYNKRFHCFPIGLLDKVTETCQEYAEYYNKEIKIYLHDRRDPKYLNRTTNQMPEKLCTDKTLRDYQADAVSTFLEKKEGIINIATGGGKTFTAAEIIRQADAKTLWIIDRKELLQQTRKELQELLGVNVGMIADGVNNPAEITIACIQSLNSKLKELQDYLYTVNFVVVDEYHKSAAESYQKVFAKLPNTKYRLGLTATPQRDDGKTPILYSILGDTICEVTTQDLIEKGYLVKPDITFYNLQSTDFSSTYSEDYKNNIVENNRRNEMIKNVVEDNPIRKILILTKLVGHGKVLQDMIPGAIHIHGSLGKNTREELMNSFRTGENKVMIMTLSIGAEGLDIPDMDIIINASGNKGDTKSIQVLGRVLRTFSTKSKAEYIDFVDCGKYTRQHSEARIRAIEAQGHEVKVL